jgi:uncharacterized protein
MSTTPPPPPRAALDPRTTTPVPARSGTGAARRVPGLDVLRGVAIIGTLASNIWLFGSFDGDRVVGAWWRDFLAWVPNGKFLGLLTIMFGIGLEIQRQAARRHGRRWPGTYPVRAGLLFLDGVLNYLFVVQFDVLRAYAIVGFVVAFVLLLPEKRQWIVIGAALAVHLAHLTVDLVVPGTLEAIPRVVLFGDVPVFLTRPTYWETVGSNAHTVLTDLTLGSDAGTIITLGLVVFTLGAMLHRKGVFEPRGARLRKWLVIGGLGVGLPLDFVGFLTGDVSGFGRYVAAPMVAFGILGLMAAFYCDHRVGFTGRRLAAVGRMALSCYVLQNIVGRALQAVIGRSPLSGMVDPVLGTMAMFVVIAALLVVFAEVWMRHFRKGPLEYVWDVCFRALTRTDRRRRRDAVDGSSPA